VFFVVVFLEVALRSGQIGLGGSPIHSLWIKFLLKGKGKNSPTEIEIQRWFFFTEEEGDSKIGKLFFSQNYFCRIYDKHQSFFFFYSHKRCEVVMIIFSQSGIFFKFLAEQMVLKKS
jgi:hypothetical protein